MRNYIRRSLILAVANNSFKYSIVISSEKNCTFYFAGYYFFINSIFKN